MNSGKYLSLYFLFWYIWYVQNVHLMGWKKIKWRAFLSRIVIAIFCQMFSDLSHLCGTYTEENVMIQISDSWNGVCKNFIIKTLGQPSFKTHKTLHIHIQIILSPYVMICNNISLSVENDAQPLEFNFCWRWPEKAECDYPSEARLGPGGYISLHKLYPS